MLWLSHWLPPPASLPGSAAMSGTPASLVWLRPRRAVAVRDRRRPKVSTSAPVLLRATATATPQPALASPRTAHALLTILRNANLEVCAWYVHACIHPPSRKTPPPAVAGLHGDPRQREIPCLRRHHAEVALRHHLHLHLVHVHAVQCAQSSALRLDVLLRAWMVCPASLTEPRLPSPSSSHSPARSCTSRSTDPSTLYAYVLRLIRARAPPRIRLRCLRRHLLGPLSPLPPTCVVRTTSMSTEGPVPYALRGPWQPPPCPLQPHLLGKGTGLLARALRVSSATALAIPGLPVSRNVWPRCAQTHVALHEHPCPHQQPQSVRSRCRRSPRAPRRAEPLCSRLSGSNQTSRARAPNSSRSTSRDPRLECLIAPVPYASRPRSSSLSPLRAQRVNFHSAPAQVSHLHLLHAPQIPARVIFLLIASPDSLRTEGPPDLHGSRAHRPRRLDLASGAPWCPFRCSFGFYQLRRRPG